MTHEQFCYFLEGMMITRRDLPTREEWQIIRDRLIDTLHPDVFAPSSDSKRLDECEQGEVKKPIVHRTIRDVINDCGPAKIAKVTKPVTIPRYVQPFTPQAPFSGEAY